MKKVVIIYHSQTGITKKYAEEIGAYLKQKELEISILPIRDYKDGIISDADYLLLGCWTSGLMIILQHPEKVWKDFALQLPTGIQSKAALFTTYKILTGSMFGKMRGQLKGRIDHCPTELKSRDGMLSEKDKTILDEWIKD
jgi:flavodoxin